MGAHLPDPLAPATAQRLTPAMSSRKLIALRFIKQYFARWGHSPTLGELAAELEVSRKRAYDLVHQLSDEKMIELIAGQTRGIRLIERDEELSEADVLLLLVARGWTVGVGGRLIEPPLNGDLVEQLTTKGLPEPLDLDHDPDVAETGPGEDGRKRESGARGGAARAPKGASRAAGVEPRRMGSSAP